MTSTPATGPGTPTTDHGGLNPATRTLLSLGAAVLVLAGMYWASDVLAPVFLAAVIVIICHPVRHPLEARGWPRWAATTAVIVVAYLILAALLAMLVFAGFQFAGLVREYLGQLQQSVAEIAAQLSALGLDAQIADAATSFVEPSRMLAVAGSVSSIVLAVATALFFVLAYAIFMAADAARYATASRVFGATHSAQIARATRFSSGVRRYFVVNASFGAVVAIVDGFALALLGVPAPVVWAILAFVTNFIPNIGFVLGLIPPVIMAFVVGGWPLALAVGAVYCVVNVVLQVLVQPKFVSDAVSLSLTLSFVSVVFWTFVIGPLGAILAIPLTLLVRALVLEGDPRTVWLRWLSGDDVTPEDELPAAATTGAVTTEQATTGQATPTVVATAPDHAPSHPAVDRVRTALDAEGADGEIRWLDDHATTAARAAEALGVPVGAIANSLVFTLDDAPVLVLTSGAHRVDTDYLGSRLGGRLARASKETVRDATGQVIGGVAPVGHPAPVRTLVDVDLRGHDVVWAAAGHAKTVFPTSYDELVRITGGTPTPVVPPAE
ncbi:Predicted PurR-regulated permease PerM [Krasilnikoviella flava]|uniref:Predicted PurR-regulated permease PerM n=1 Tax=Krasilnikoviella flava TaxID=526729 RepID=A0A1T5LQP0_9MICO|nr:Predicted PurR-regulated permease PerM [Krasilnikoviella flava]